MGMDMIKSFNKKRDNNIHETIKVNKISDVEVATK